MTKKEICKEGTVKKNSIAVKKKNLIALIAFCLLSVSCMTVPHSRESIQLLIAEEGNLDVKDSDGRTALTWAAHYGHIEELNALINAGADLDKSTSDGMTALMEAARNGHIEVLNALIKAGADLNLIGGEGRTALMEAAYSGHIEELNALIEAGADIDPHYDGSKTALMEAIDEGHTEIAKILIEAGADIAIKDKYSVTALIWASIKGSTEIAKMLIEAGADIDKISLVIRDRIVAPKKTSVDLAEEAYAERTGVEYYPDHYYLEYGHSTALMYATITGHTEIVKILIEAGAYLDEIDVDGWTALINAIRNGHTAIAKMLIEAGANLDIKTVAQRMITGVSEYEENLIDYIRKELDSDYEPPPYDYTYGYIGHDTALIYAATYGHTEIAKALIEAGVDIDAQDMNDYTALSWASYFEYTDIVNLLKEAGAE